MVFLGKTPALLYGDKRIQCNIINYQRRYEYDPRVTTSGWHTFEIRLNSFDDSFYQISSVQSNSSAHLSFVIEPFTIIKNLLIREIFNNSRELVLQLEEMCI